MVEMHSDMFGQCSSDAISAYIDGELGQAEEDVFERHLAECPECRIELNNQKTFILALNGSLERESDPELPADFVRNVVVSAESGVSGLVGRRERVTAAIILGVLLLSVFVLAGREVLGSFGASVSLFEKAGSVVLFVLRLAFSFFYGATVFLRSILTRESLGSPFVWLIAAASLSVFILAARPIRRFFRT